ncbi:glucose dehydrogenase [Natrarchaeobaculum aegyptiacum]|uniref:Glucose dehydrogenase n=1 Tax=Natrarchaeobaculum aegyptiacum TaxID=745377 RepID=A0A2Z2HXN8_9EURY|nr:glucose dehydrogenase [Natrarchaeobaculum aegyptiacum]
MGGGLTAALAGCVDALETSVDDPFAVETVVDGLAHPWAMAIVPGDSRLLVTEREGRLSLVDREGGSHTEVDGAPVVYVTGQGGLLDVALHPDFPDDPRVYLTYSIANDDGESTTAVGRARLEADDGDDPELTDGTELYVAEPWLDSSGHFGSRAVFGPDDRLYVSVGDRREDGFDAEHVSQDRSNDLGTTLRLEPDGSIPDDNPFVDDEDAVDAIYTYGHRNAQGMTVHPETDELWQSEHGEEDGDELNVLEAGSNYGWPIAHYGCAYGTDEPIGDEPADRDDVVDPVYYWKCGSGGFPPAGMTFYDGDTFPEWQGDLLVGNLAGQYLGRFSVDGTDVSEKDRLLEGRGWRIRDVVVAPDTGDVYVAVDDGDAPIVRLTPQE